MDRDNKMLKLEPEAERKVVDKDVKKMRKLMPEVFGQLDLGITTIPELMTAMQQRAIVDEVYYAKLKKTQDKVSNGKQIIH